MEEPGRGCLCRSRPIARARQDGPQLLEILTHEALSTLFTSRPRGQTRDRPMVGTVPDGRCRLDETDERYWRIANQHARNGLETPTVRPGGQSSPRRRKQLFSLPQQRQSLFVRHDGSPESTNGHDQSSSIGFSSLARKDSRGLGLARVKEAQISRISHAAGDPAEPLPGRAESAWGRRARAVGISAFRPGLFRTAPRRRPRVSEVRRLRKSLRDPALPL